MGFEVMLFPTYSGLFFLSVRITNLLIHLSQKYSSFESVIHTVHRETPLEANIKVRIFFKSMK